MKTIFIVACLLCLLGCGDMAIAPLQNQIDRESEIRGEFDREVLDMVMNVFDRIRKIEDRHMRMWKLANTHEIKQDEEIKELQTLTRGEGK